MGQQSMSRTTRKMANVTDEASHGACVDSAKRTLIPLPSDCNQTDEGLEKNHSLALPMHLARLRCAFLTSTAQFSTVVENWLCLKFIVVASFPQLTALRALENWANLTHHLSTLIITTTTATIDNRWKIANLNKTRKTLKHTTIVSAPPAVRRVLR
jgi:hypothetical protein